MAGIHSSAIILDHTLQLSITNLKIWGYIQNNSNKQGQITWTKNCGDSNKVLIETVTDTNSPHIFISYLYNNIEVTKKIYFVLKASNLGKGKLWFFKCSKTDRLCRKLYFHQGEFVHRSHIKSSLYECQTRSRQTRELYQFHTVNLAEEEINSKYFKKHYSGKPTRRYKYLTNKQSRNIIFS